MKTLRRLTSLLVLMLVLGVPAFAGELSTPPCAPPVPGELSTPPCQEAASGDAGGPSSLSTAATTDETFTRIATEVLQSLLSIF